VTTDATTNTTNTMTNTMTGEGPRSMVMHAAARHYDLLAGLLTLGRERALRERLADLARLAPGEHVLDVGCGTGSLALAAKRRVGPTGTVRGVDASPEMVAQARAKAARTELAVAFDVARAEALPCPDGSVDVVLGTLMLHHLPAVVRERFAHEIRRVLKPGGRVLAVDFEAPARKRGGLIARLHRHGGVPLARVVQLLEDAGLRVIDRGSVGASDLQFALAVVARDTDDVGTDAGAPPQARALPPLPAPRWALPAALAAVVLVHLLAARLAWSTLALGAVAGAGVLAFAAVVVAHVGAAGGVHALLRGRRSRR
jgi:ubiquinone/menaquinone biosynthesis C-methylase UbiE